MLGQDHCLFNPFKYTDPSGEDLKDWGTPACQRGKLIFPDLEGVEYTSAFDSTPLELSSNPFFDASYGDPVIMLGLSDLTSRGIGFNGIGDGYGGDGYITNAFWKELNKTPGWPTLPSDQFNQVSNSKGYRSHYSKDDLINDAHLMLDAAGLIYDPIDIAHGIWYGYEGNYEDAGMCMLSAVPVLGIGVTAAKWAKKGLKYVDEAGEGIGKSYTMQDIRNALEQVYKKTDGPLPKAPNGKFSSPQRGKTMKGYRLDPGHKGFPQGHPESVPHINYWDYTKGKRGKGGIKGAFPIIKP